MPFTAAHPAIVVPLARAFPRWTVLPALVVGSLSPDFEYFVHLQPIRTIGHDLMGVAAMDVPAALVALLVFDRIIKGPLIDLLPDKAQARLAQQRDPIAFGPAGRLMILLTSLAIGALSHLGWDAFTHADGPFVRGIPALSATALSVAGRDVKVFKLAQHGSTLVGLVLLGWWTVRWYVRQPVAVVAPRLSSRVRGKIAMAILFTAGLGGCLPAVSHASGSGVAGFVGRLVVSTISVFLVALLIYSVTVRGASRVVVRSHHV